MKYKIVARRNGSEFTQEMEEQEEFIKTTKYLLENGFFVLYKDQLDKWAVQDSKGNIQFFKTKDIF